MIVENNKFTLKSENTPSEFQLSFDDFKTLSENVEVTSKIPYVDYLLLEGRDFKFPSKRYFFLSLVIHSMLFATVLFFALNPELLPQEPPKKELITIELEPSSQGFSSASSSANSSAADTAVNSSSAVTTQSVVSNEEATPVIPVKKESAKVTKPKTVKVAPRSSMAASTRPSSSVSSAVETFEPANNIDDIAVPALAEINESETSSMTKSSPILDDIKSDLDEIDSDSNAKILAANQELEEMSQQQMTDIESQTSALSDEEDPLASVAEQRKTQLAQERKALAAQAAAATLAAQKAAAAKAQQQHGQGNANNTSGMSSATDSNGTATQGDGNSTGNSVSQNGAGTGDGQVRKLEELRQMPGNKKPEYDTEDRLKGLSGTIVMYGFVTKEGTLSSFKMIQSTGHRSLDKKTLVALKKWRFYPGQEGWVELPFKWDLKGGVQQKPTLLKRR